MPRLASCASTPFTSCTVRRLAPASGSEAAFVPKRWRTETTVRWSAVREEVSAMVETLRAVDNGDRNRELHHAARFEREVDNVVVGGDEKCLRQPRHGGTNHDAEPQRSAGHKGVEGLLTVDEEEGQQLALCLSEDGRRLRRAGG